MKKATSMVTGALCAVIIAAGIVSAQPGPKRGPDSGKERPHRMWKDLNLKDDQKNKLKALHDEMQKVRKKHFETVKKVRAKIKDELLKDSPSQKALYGYAGELGELHKQMTKERSDHLLKVKTVLSKEQFKKLLEHERRMGKGKFGHRGECKGCPHEKGCRKGGKGHGNGPKDGSGPGCEKNK